MSRALRGLPQAVMGRQIAVTRAKVCQPVLNQREVFGFLIGNLNPSVERRIWALALPQNAL